MRLKNLFTVPLLEILFLFSMSLTLLISSNIEVIFLWEEIPLLLYLRTFFWFVGLSILPGFYILRFVRVGEKLPTLIKFATTINLSLVVIGLINVTSFYLQINTAFNPLFILGLLWVLFLLYYVKVFTLKAKPDLPNFRSPLTVCIGAAIMIALFVQIGQAYLIPGDVWVALNPAIQIIQRNEFNAFGGRYPVIFGFILGSFSSCIGLPIVNSFSIMFPFVVLNIISFYSLLKVVFGASNRIAALGSIVYTFSGGFAWLFQTFVYQGTQTLSGLSFLTEDIYFSMSFWNTMEFSHRTLALTLAYMSIVLLVICFRQTITARKFTILALSSLLLVFSFLIHMLEALIFIPLIVILVFAYQREKTNFVALGVLTIFTLIITCYVDYIMSGYYSWLSFEKICLFLSSINSDKFPIYLALLTVGFSTVILSWRFLSKSSKKFHVSKTTLYRIKLFITGSLVVFYTLGLYYASILDPQTQNSHYLSSSFPWYLYVTRYGFIGLFALIGVAATDWKEKWFKITATWSIIILAIGSIWWDTRMNAYLFPILALLAATGIHTIWQKAHNTIHITITTTKNQTGKHLKINLKPIIATLLITTIALSFTSLIGGAAYYITSGPSLNDDTVKTLQWINKNTPQNATILVPNIYNIYKSVKTIADRKIYLDTHLPTTVDPISFANLTQNLQTHNIQYALTTEDANQQGYLTKLLLTYSNLTFQSGQNKIYKLPKLTPPISKSSIAILDKEPLGLTNTTSFAWLDDNFTANWTYKNVNVATDGETLTYQWTFHTNNTQEPSMKIKITPTNTNIHPYLIISYRNTPETTPTAENNIGQIITLINTTGYPTGFIENIYFPVTRQQTYNILITKLPENQNISDIWIWMRNYQKLNGTITLKIDYVGLTTTYSTLDNPTNIQFLTMTIPSLWKTNYTITRNPTETQNASTIISTYDKSKYNFIVESNNTKIFVFFNQTVTLPSWGSNWQEVHPNIITGTMNEKKIIFCKIRDISNENILVIADIIYNQIQYP